MSMLDERTGSWNRSVKGPRSRMRSGKGDPFQAGRNKKQHRVFRPALAETIELFLYWEENRGDPSKKDHDDTSCSA
jgi:hypothetical protein